MRENKLVYIASPYAGDVEKNVEFAKAACRYAVAEGHTPIAVHLMYPRFLNDGDPEERSRGLRMGLRVLLACDELWLCGDHLSIGMQEEKEFAKKLGIPIRMIPSHLIEVRQELGAMEEVKEAREIREAIEAIEAGPAMAWSQ